MGEADPVAKATGKGCFNKYTAVFSAACSTLHSPTLRPHIIMQSTYKKLTLSSRKVVDTDDGQHIVIVTSSSSALRLSKNPGKAGT